MSAGRFSQVPQKMRQADRWVLWGGTKKIPYQVSNPDAEARSNDPSTWGSFDDAVTALPFSGRDGIGFVLGDGFTGIDLDACRQPGDQQSAAQWAKRIVELCNSYTEISPSDVGAKVFMFGLVPTELDGKHLPMPGDPIQVNGSKKSPQVETYLGYNAKNFTGKGRYFTVTGQRIGSAPRELSDGAAGWRHVQDLAEKNGKAGKGPAGPVDAEKLTSGRHKAMVSLAGTMRRRGMTDAEILAALRQFNQDRCDPQCPDADVRQIAESVAKYPAEGEVSNALDTFSAADADVTHDTLALGMGQAWRDARYVAAWGKWFFWRDSRWLEDQTLAHMTRCRAFLREVSEQLLTWDADRDDKTRRRAQSDAESLKHATTVAQVVGLSRSNPAQVATVAQWDADSRLVSTPEATIELSTGKSREPRMEDYITKSTAADPAPAGARVPLWDRFLGEVTGEDPDLIDYLQRVAGYCLSGLVEEHVLFFLHGTGANGKSVFVNTLQGIWGDYATTINNDMLMISHSDRHPTEVARLRGARLAVGGELEVGRTWAESKIKQLTGGDRLIGRFMRQDFFEFDPQFKLMIVGNHKPSLRGVDEAVRRRFNLIPFTVTIPPEKRDIELGKKLEAEWPAILRWAVDGFQSWQKIGLAPPESVVAATDKYLDDEDDVGRWIDERCDLDPNNWQAIDDLYVNWKDWAESSGVYVLSKKKLAGELEDRGLDRDRNKNARGHRGICIRPGQELHR